MNADTWSTATSCSRWIAQSWKEDGRLARPGIVATVMSNLGLERFLEGLGLELVRTPVGDRYVLERMLSGGYNLGGEPSGHIILSDYATTGDGLSRRCRCSRWCKNFAARCRKSVTASIHCRRS